MLDKYESFTSMVDVFGNVIPSVRYRKVGDEERIRVFLKETTKYGNNDPIYIVDGLMTENTKYILGLDPKFVHRIGVLRSEETLARFGDLGRDGILLIETNGINTRKELSNSGNSLSIIGISNALEFKKTEHSKAETNLRVPDLRACLYWNPIIDLNKEKIFDFYTGDDEGYYIIQIAGLVDGIPFLTTKRFFVSLAAE